MRALTIAAAAVALGAAGSAAAESAVVTPVLVTAVAAQIAPRRVASLHRLGAVAAPAASVFHVDDPRSPLRRSFGGSMVDLFPVEGGKLRLSAGGRLFGRAGRPRPVSSDPESLRYLQPFRAGGLRARRFAPAMLVGYGRTVEQGLALGVDAGFLMGRVGATPDRFGRLNRQRLDAMYGRGRRGLNQLARVTALYRF